MTQQELKLLWYRALAEPIGLLLSSPDPGKAKQALYRARAQAGDPALAQVQIRVCQLQGGNLMLVRESIQLGSQVEPQLSNDLNQL